MLEEMTIYNSFNPKTVFNSFNFYREDYRHQIFADEFATCKNKYLSKKLNEKIVISSRKSSVIDYYLQFSF